MPKPKLIAIVGPTASGKTSLSIFLAQQMAHLSGKYAEIISADSRQVYKGLDIGTGKVTEAEMMGIPHHLLDVVPPTTNYSVSDFVKAALEACFSILGNNKIPIVVGGTGLYVDTLLGRMVIAEVGPNEALRTSLEQKSLSDLLSLLESKDPARAVTVDRHNKRRVIRALEIAEALGATPPGGPLLSGESKYDILWLGVRLPQEILFENIHTRLLSRIEDGMIEEAVALHTQGLSYERMIELGLEYRSLAYYLQGQVSKEDFIVQLETTIRNYTKRQLRWFKRNPDIHWVENKEDALKLVRQFLFI